VVNEKNLPRFYLPELFGSFLDKHVVCLDKVNFAYNVFKESYAFSLVTYLELFFNRTNQECFEEAFLPTLQTLANAPASSPLAEIDITNVAELLVDLTRPSGLNPQAKNPPDYQVGEYISLWMVRVVTSMQVTVVLVK